MRRVRGFTLIELLVAVAVVGTLISVMLPALSGARESANAVICASNQRQLVTAWRAYANDYRGRAMPLAYTSLQDVGTGDSVFWWGSAGNVSGAVDRSRGFLSPYIDDELGAASVYECPNQPEGTYRPQGSTGELTTTYGYNGYYLSPPKTPGWSFSIGHRPWRRISSIDHPAHLLVFGDALLPGSTPRSTSLLDPPMLYDGGGEWRENTAPTTAFRHHTSGDRGTAVAVRADGSAVTARSQHDWIVDRTNKIGSIGTDNSLRYVPDWERWHD